MAQAKKVQNKDMPKEVSIMGGCPVPDVCSPLLFLAEVEAEGRAKKARLRAQQRGRVAKGKKSRLREAWGLLRHLWGKIRRSKADSEWIEVFCPFCRSHFSIEVYHAAPIRRPERKGQPSRPVLKMPWEKEESGK